MKAHGGEVVQLLLVVLSTRTIYSLTGSLSLIVTSPIDRGGKSQ